MRLPPSEHYARPWRIHEIAYDFKLLDAWALPTVGERRDFPRLVRLISSFDPTTFGSRLVRSLVDIRFKLGDAFGWDEVDAGVGGRVASVADRLPEDLSAEAPASGFEALPAEPLYLTDDELVGELANQTVHALLHVGWVEESNDRFRGQLAILVKPNGLFGQAYVAAIQPFRYLIVYPALMREIQSRWEAEAPSSLQGR